MLNIVAHKGFKKEEPQTPREFAGTVHRDLVGIHEDVATVTDNFCRTFYGEKALTKTELAETEVALKRLKERCSAKNEG
jgi:hypothetical protein